MRGSKLAKAMAVAVDRLVSACEGASALDRAIEATVDKISRFSGKDATSYLEAYKSEMEMRNIPEDRQLIGFPRVVTPHIHTEMVEIQTGCRDWGDFAEEFLKRYITTMTRSNYRERTLWIGSIAPTRVKTLQRSLKSLNRGSRGSLGWTGLCSRQPRSFF